MDTHPNDATAGVIILQSVISGVFAGLVIIAVTFLIERLGGIKGGVLGTVPTTIVAASIGFVLQEADLDESLFLVPVGVFVDAGFLAVWRYVPPRLSKYRYTMRKELIIMVVVSLAFWVAGVSALFFLAEWLMGLGVPVQAFGIGFTVLQTVFGGSIALLKSVPAPRAKERASMKIFAARSVVVAIAIFVAVLVSKFSPGIGGILATFPAVFLVTMVGLAVSHGHALPQGAIAPMMLGVLSVNLYTMLFAVQYPIFFELIDNTLLTLVVVVSLTFVEAVLVGSIPVFLFLRHLEERRRRQNHDMVVNFNLLPGDVLDTDEEDDLDMLGPGDDALFEL